MIVRHETYGEAELDPVTGLRVAPLIEVNEVEVPDDPAPEVATDPVVALAQGIRDALSALTPSSTSAAQRTALLALREKADAVLNEVPAAEGGT